MTPLYRQVWELVTSIHPIRKLHRRAPGAPDLQPLRRSAAHVSAVCLTLYRFLPAPHSNYIMNDIVSDPLFLLKSVHFEKNIVTFTNGQTISLATKQNKTQASKEVHLNTKIKIKNMHSCMKSCYLISNLEEPLLTEGKERCPSLLPTRLREVG